MENPLMILPCLSAQLELYPDHLIFRPKGSWAWISRMTELHIPLSEIESARILEINPRLSGVMEIKRRDAHPKSIYVLYARAHDHQAATFYEMLDDLLTRKDVLPLIRAMEPS